MPSLNRDHIEDSSTNLKSTRRKEYSAEECRPPKNGLLKSLGFQILDCNGVSTRKGYSFGIIRSCSLKDVAFPISHDVIPSTKNLVITVLSEDVGISLSAPEIGALSKKGTLWSCDS